MNEDIDGKTNQDEKSSGNMQLFFAIAIVIVIGVTLILAMQGNNITGPIAANVEGQNLVIETSSLDPRAKFYYYDVDGVQVRFFAVEDYDGGVHVAFDACDVCFEAKKGYTQKDALMECRNCGNRFLIDGIGTENLAGGCWPSYLPITLTESVIYIQISDVVAKKFMFT